MVKFGDWRFGKALLQPRGLYHQRHFIARVNDMFLLAGVPEHELTLRGQLVWTVGDKIY